MLPGAFPYPTWRRGFTSLPSLSLPIPPPNQPPPRESRGGEGGRALARGVPGEGRRRAKMAGCGGGLCCCCCPRCCGERESRTPEELVRPLPPPWSLWGSPLRPLVPQPSLSRSPKAPLLSVGPRSCQAWCLRRCRASCPSQGSSCPARHCSCWGTGCRGSAQLLRAG